MTTRPPRPAREEMEAAACWPAVEWSTGVMLHDCRHPDEPEAQWKSRYTAARAVCRRCPVYTACGQLKAHYRGHRKGIDGILAGEPTSAPLYDLKESA